MVVTTRKKPAKKKSKRRRSRSLRPSEQSSPLAIALRREERCLELVAKWTSAVSDSPEAHEYEQQLQAYVLPGRYSRISDTGIPEGCVVSALVVDRRSEKRSADALFVVVDFEDVERPSLTIVPLVEFVKPIDAAGYQGPRFKRIGDFEPEA